MNRNYKLQQFTAPDNIVVTTDLNTTTREIDFVTMFEKDIQALLDVMSIARMIKKENGSTLYTKTVTGTLTRGDNIAEGDVIPYSHYEVEKTALDSISVDKYRMGVSLEAIAEKGYAVAVDDTETEFQADLRNEIMDKFYTALQNGTLTGTYKTWQMGFAMSIGKVKDKFKKMHKTATGIATFVNTLDLYEYLGGAQVQIQTAFGLEYITNFLGADVVFISSEIPVNTIISTPLNNLVAYYVDPADSEFVQAGLQYTTDTITGMIGVHAQGNYDRALSEMFAIMGVRLFAEYVDGIAKITINPSATSETPKV